MKAKNKVNLKKNLKFKYKKRINRDVILNIGSRGFTLIELIATIAIISIISTVAIFSVTTLIKSSEEKSLQTTYSSLKETAATLSKELTDDYWDIDGNTYISCVSVKDMKNEGYYKKDDFDNVDGVEDSTFVIVKKDIDSKVIISSEIDKENEYCSKNFNNANLKVKSYTPSTITVEADCGSGNYNYLYSLNDSNYESGNKNYTFTGLTENTKYNLHVTCSKKDDTSVEKQGTIEKTTGKSNTIIIPNECTPKPLSITVNYNDGKNYYFKLTSSGSIDSKYEAKECTGIDSSCSNNTITYIKSNTWYKVNSKNEKISINNNGTIYTYSSSNDNDIKFSSSSTNTITTIDKSTPNTPTIKPSDSISSGNWHKNNYNINLSGGESSEVNSKCKGVTYEYSTDNKNFATISNNSMNISEEIKSKTYYFRTKAKNGNVSESVEYVSKLDKTKPVCSFSNINEFRKTYTINIDMTCTDNLSGIVYKNLSSSNFNTKNVSITSISSPQSISDGYKYTISIKGDTIGNDSYIQLKSNVINDNAGNSNNSKNSNTFKVLPNTYTLTYNTNGGSSCNPSSKTVTYGEKYGTLCTPTRTGYTFDGWYTSSSGGNKVTSDSTYNTESNQTIYAHWNAKTYTIKYNSNGGSGSMNATTATYGKNATISSNNFTRNGYSFIGWTTKSNGSDDGYGWTNWSGTWNYDNGQYGISNNTLNLYARWSENTQSINGYRCSGSDLYYITTCGLGTGNCNYTYKNDASVNGTIVRNTLNGNMTSCSNYQVNNSSTYTKTLNRALNLVDNSNTIKVLNDVSDSSSVTISKNVTLDTNGKTITRNKSIVVNSTLTSIGTGKIYSESSRIFEVSGTLKIQGGTYESNVSSGSVDAIYLNSSGNIVLNDVNEINIWSDNGCGSAIMSDSSNSINVNATSAGIKLYGYCYGIWAKDATVNVTSSYNGSIYGVTNWIEAIKGYAIRAKNINFGSNNYSQDGSKYFNPGARSQSYTTNTSTFNVLFANESINYKSGTLYSTYSYGKFQKDCYTSASCNNFGSPYTYKPYYTGISDTIGSVKGSIFTNVTPNISWGYGQYFTSSYDTLALRIVKSK